MQSANVSSKIAVFPGGPISEMKGFTDNTKKASLWKNLFEVNRASN